MTPLGSHGILNTLIVHARNPRAWFILFLLTVTGYRLSLINRGHFYFSDEQLYWVSSWLVDELHAGQRHLALSRLYDACGRPGFVCWNAAVVLVQRAAAALLDIPPNTPSYFAIVSFQNVLVALGITICVFKLALLWTRRAGYALLAAGVHALLANSNTWIRHIVPYHESLLLFLIALCVLCRADDDAKHGNRRIILAGLLTGLAYTVYPGHYAFVLINGSVAWLGVTNRCKHGGAAWRAGVFTLSSLLVLALFEHAGKYCGRSYVDGMSKLSGTITGGDTAEGYLFPWRYLRDAEGPVGMVLLIFFVGFILCLSRRRRVDVPLPARVAILAAATVFLFHASLGVWFGKMVFYGRLLMAYLPFLVLGAVLALKNLESVYLRRGAIGVLAAASACSFLVFAREYSRIEYPADFLQRTMPQAASDGLSFHSMVWENIGAAVREPYSAKKDPLVMAADPTPNGTDYFVRLQSHEAARASGGKYIGVNLRCLIYVGKNDDRFTAPLGYEVMEQSLHPETLSAYQFEGRRPEERARLRDRRYTMRIYVLEKDAVASGAVGGTVKR